MHSRAIKLIEYLSRYMFFKQRLASILCVNSASIEKFYNSLYESSFFLQIKKKVSAKGGIFDLSMLNPMRAPALYVVCRVLKPKIVLETGVANGFSSAFLLQALEDNDEGKLYSIDLPNQPGEEIESDAGWLVPDGLKSRWELIIGNSKEILPDLVGKLKKIDVFYHDSDHRYSHVMFELRAVWNKIVQGGIISADDVALSNAFVDFSIEQKIGYEKFFWLGIAKKK